MRSFHGNSALKASMVADASVNIKPPKPQDFAEVLGMPEWLGHLDIWIHSELYKRDAAVWRQRLFDAIPVGVDVQPVHRQITIARMDRLLHVCTDKDVRASIEAVLGSPNWYSSAYPKWSARSARKACLAAELIARAHRAAGAATLCGEDWRSTSGRSAYAAAWKAEAETLLECLAACKVPS